MGEGIWQLKGQNSFFGTKNVSLDESTSPEFNRMKQTGVLLHLHLQTAFVWAR